MNGELKSQKPPSEKYKIMLNKKLLQWCGNNFNRYIVFVNIH